MRQKEIICPLCEMYLYPEEWKCENWDKKMLKNLKPKSKEKNEN